MYRVSPSSRTSVPPRCIGRTGAGLISFGCNSMQRYWSSLLGNNLPRSTV